MSTNRIDGDYGEKAGYPPGKDVMCGTYHLIHHRKEQREKYEKWPL